MVAPGAENWQRDPDEPVRQMRLILDFFARYP
jgi:hypothetical protein